MRLAGSDDFTSLKVVVQPAEHVWLSPELLTATDGRTSDPRWRESLDRMTAYAAPRGWTDEHGRLRAHIELAS